MTQLRLPLPARANQGQGKLLPEKEQEEVVALMVAAIIAVYKGGEKHDATTPQS